MFILMVPTKLINLMSVIGEHGFYTDYFNAFGSAYQNCNVVSGVAGI